MEDKIKEYLQHLKQVSAPESYEKTSAWVRNRFTRQEKAGLQLLIINKYMTMKKMKLAYALIALLVLVGACNYPVPYNENMGTVLSWQADETQGETVKAIADLPWKKTYPIMVSETNENGTTTLKYTAVLNTSDQEAINTIAASVQRIPGIRNLARVPMNSRNSKPLYAIALDKFFNVHIKADGMTDAELKNQIDEQLKKSGLTGMQVSVVRDEKGERRIEMQRTEVPKEDMDLGITVEDGNRVDVLKQKVRMHGEEGGNLPDFSKMSDNEIKDHFIKEHPDMNLSREDIQLTRDDSKLTVEIDKNGMKQKMVIRTK